MPVHDWTLVEAGIFHAFHTVWIGEIQAALNEGMLPRGYYALAEQHAGQFVADILTLHDSTHSLEPLSPLTDVGGTALAEAPPKVRRRLTVEPASTSSMQRTLAIRHVSDHRLIAMIEILSPANKDRRSHLDSFVEKAVTALERGIHLLLVDLFPPGPHDPHGTHSLIRQSIDGSEISYDLPAEEPLTLASYVASRRIEIFLEHLAVGAPLPEMPLFLSPERYINVPLDTTYQAAYRGMPAFWRDVLNNREPRS